MWAKNKQTGFTIVELLIVIVVIAILAVITIVAYNGIQARAENAKTLSAVSMWAKALQMYKTDKGYYPVMHSCLGDTNTYTSSFSGRCYDAEGGTTWVVQQAFLDEMKTYLGSFPIPSSKNAHTETLQRRGAIYYRQSAGAEKIYVTVINQTNCPEISGLGSSYGSGVITSGRTCYYDLP